MKLWIDDVRLAPEECVWCRSIGDAKYCIKRKENFIKSIDKQAVI